MSPKEITISEEAYQLIIKRQKENETISDTILRVVKEYEQKTQPPKTIY